MSGLLLILAACSGPDSDTPTPLSQPTTESTAPSPTLASEPTNAASTPAPDSPSPTPEPTATPSPTPEPTPPPGGYEISVGSRAEEYDYDAVAAYFPEGVEFQAASHQLALRPWSPTDARPFSASLYAGSIDHDFAQGPSPTDDELMAQLRSQLGQRFAESPENVDVALTLIDNDQLRATVSDTRLRVAALALIGTMAQPTIGEITSNFAAVEFAELDGSRLTQTVMAAGADGMPRPTLLIDQRLQHEHFALLSVVLVQGLLDDDGSLSRDEQRITAMLAPLVHMQQLLTMPDLVDQPTWLAQHLNTLTLGRLNAGAANRMTVRETNRPVFPDSLKAATSYLDYVDSELLLPVEAESSGPSSVLAGLLGALGDPSPATVDDMGFDTATMDFIDGNHAMLGPVELLTVACILRLDITICNSPPGSSPPAITAVALFDSDNEPLRFLSADEHPYFDGLTIAQGAMVLTGDPNDHVAAAAVEVLQNGIVIARGEIPAAPHWPAFGYDRTLRLDPAGGFQFAFASSQFAGIDRTTDEMLTMRVWVTTASGIDIAYDAGQVGKLVRYRGENRYEDRDEARGGDDWLTPSALAVLEYFGDEIVIGDISDMNGGPFPPHQTHQAGIDIDAWFWGYNELDAATAEVLLSHLNDPVMGSRIELVYVTYEQADSDPLWLAIRDVTLADGRLARDVIQPYPGHDTHFHWRVTSDE